MNYEEAVNLMKTKYDTGTRNPKALKEILDQAGYVSPRTNQPISVFGALSMATRGDKPRKKGYSFSKAAFNKPAPEQAKPIGNALLVTVIKELLALPISAEMKVTIISSVLGHEKR